MSLDAIFNLIKDDNSHPTLNARCILKLTTINRNKIMLELRFLNERKIS